MEWRKPLLKRMQSNDVEDRYKKLLQDKRCFICLGQNHRAKECRRSKNCRECHGRHHQAICKRKSTQHEEPSRTATHDNTEITTTTTNTSRSGVMLQIATAYARGNGSDKAVEARIIFDSGSQRSYVSKNLREKQAPQQLSLRHFI